MPGSAQTTTDHKKIRQWIEDRGGRPCAVSSTHKEGQGGLLRVDFGEPEANLEEIPWEEFFKTFDDRGLAFLYQETKDGKPSRFFKFVARES